MPEDVAPPRTFDQIDWTAHLSGADPYLVWAVLTGFRGFKVAGKRFQVAVETVGPEEPWKAQSESRPDGDESAPTEPRRVGDDRTPRKICTSGKGAIWTGRVDQAQLVELVTSGHHKIELNVPQRHGAAPAAGGVEVLDVATDFLGKSVIAVIDHGCPFAHRQFLVKPDGRWSSRVRYLWDQDTSIDPGASWLVPKSYYGREMSTKEMDELLQSCLTAAGEIDEDRVYSVADYAAMDNRKTHGAHVLDLAAGEFNPMTGQRDEVSRADIVFVQLPRLTVADTSGGSMTKYVLDALHYIFARAANADRLVINLSYGSTAGPHDGSSMLERAIDTMIVRERAQRRGGQVEIVLPAGNHFLAQGHAALRFEPGRSERTLAWQVMPDDPTDSFLELWYPAQQAGTVSISITQPDGTSLAGQVPVDKLEVLEDRGCVVGAVVHSRRTPNGSGAMVLVALCPTHPDAWEGQQAGSGMAPRLARADHGVWTVTVHVDCDCEFEVNAWIERDDPIGGQRGQRPSHFFASRHRGDADDDDRPGDTVWRRTTGNSIANGRLPVVVGAAVRSSGALSEYTAAGPTLNPQRTVWPDWLAPGDESASLGGLLAAGTRSGYLVRMNGTSVAAPQVARHLMNVFIRPPASAQPQPVSPPQAPTLADLRGARARIVP